MQKSFDINVEHEMFVIVIETCYVFLKSLLNGIIRIVINPIQPNVFSNTNNQAEGEHIAPALYFIFAPP